MTSSSPPNFSNRNLRNRSFKGQNLNGADFRGSDIRGCDFSHALLQGANFERVRAGRTLRQLIPLVVVAVVVGLLAVDAYSQMIFGVLGRTSAEPAWSYVIALYVSLAIAGTFCAARVLTGSKLIAEQVATIVSGAASGALLGFFYGGSTTNNNPQMAIAGAVIGGLVMAIAISFRVSSRFISVGVAVAGAVAGYGFAFLVGTTAIAYSSAQKLVWAVIWGSLSIVYIGLTMTSLTLAVKEITEASGTSFRGADLTNARFDAGILQNADFRGAIGDDQLNIQKRSCND